MSRRINISENQLSLPFSQRGARTISYDQRIRFFWFLAGVAICSLALYIYAIEATARNVALRENLETRVTEAESKLSSLEFAYIKLKNNVSMELAHQYGFREASSPLYVSRSYQGSLTLNTVSR
ncbi:MAG: hypothetical protein Q7S54_01300 [bacterium]|nr:hypothetical protein [bacterium]